ncbi:hypothetical protein DM785_02445 [Deinococcus actinosclerus]|nr:hypothetical protein DM785_02445 [Deinococcus actinosclerus]
MKLRCAPAQLGTQVTRWHANAVMRALHRGPVTEHALPGTWRGTSRPPNATVELPRSFIMEDFFKVQKRIDRSERLIDTWGGEAPAELRSDYQRLIRRRDALLDEARQALDKTPEWPFVAGLYALHVPALDVQAGVLHLRVPARTCYRHIDVHDDDPIWPTVKAALNKTPRGATDQPGRPFRAQTQDGKRTLQREVSVATSALTDWLAALVPKLDMDVLADGDYLVPVTETPDPYTPFLVLTGDIA